MKTNLLKILVLFVSLSAFAQIREQEDYPNRFSVGINIIDDTYTKTRKVSDYTKQWNSAVYPSRFGYERWINESFGVEASLSLNKFKKGKLIDGYINPQDLSHLAIDLNGKYYLNNAISAVFNYDLEYEPFIVAGLGHTSIETFDSYQNINYGLGVIFWFGPKQKSFVRGNFLNSLGFYAQTLGKSSFDQEKFGNEIQYSAGLMYKF